MLKPGWGLRLPGSTRYGRDVEWYETTLYSDEEALEAPCTARAVIYNVFGIAGFIGNQVKRFVRNQPYSREIIWDYVTMTLLTT